MNRQSVDFFLNVNHFSLYFPVSLETSFPITKTLYNRDSSLVLRALLITTVRKVTSWVKAFKPGLYNGLDCQ